MVVIDSIAPEELLDGLVLLQRGLKARSVGESPPGRVNGQKFHLMKNVVEV